LRPTPGEFGASSPVCIHLLDHLILPLAFLNLKAPEEERNGKEASFPARPELLFSRLLA
jgi:hypothetical protein